MQYDYSLQLTTVECSLRRLNPQLARFGMT
jgi:hypothetical protein